MNSNVKTFELEKLVATAFNVGVVDFQFSEKGFYDATKLFEKFKRYIALYATSKNQKWNIIVTLWAKIGLFLGRTEQFLKDVVDATSFDDAIYPVAQCITSVIIERKELSTEITETAGSAEAMKRLTLIYTERIKKIGGSSWSVTYELYSYCVSTFVDHLSSLNDFHAEHSSKTLSVCRPERMNEIVELACRKPKNLKPRDGRHWNLCLFVMLKNIMVSDFGLNRTRILLGGKIYLAEPGDLFLVPNSVEQEIDAPEYVMGVVGPDGSTYHISVDEKNAAEDLLLCVATLFNAENDNVLRFISGYESSYDKLLSNKDRR